MNRERATAVFSGLVDLASERLGGRIEAVNDDFFASADCMLKSGDAVFIEDKYTERGKWMDGWESRRKRGPGHDWCVIKLGASGIIRGVDLDTHHFLGNHAPYACLEGANLSADVQSWEQVEWTEILPQSPLQAGSQNIFGIYNDSVWTHVRLRIFPDGGVARCRIYGEVVSSWQDGADDTDPEIQSRRRDREVDLVALRHGGQVIACSDMFFSPMNNLIMPGRAPNMGEGWESRRRRGPGHDWAIIQLATPGSVGFVEVDTNHFKGNYPDRFSLEALHGAGLSLTELIDAEREWEVLVAETKLEAHNRLFLRDEIRDLGVVTHLKLRIFPDGGVSRLRVYGERQST